MIVLAWQTRSIVIARGTFGRNLQVGEAEKVWLSSSLAEPEHRPGTFAVPPKAQRGRRAYRPHRHGRVKSAGGFGLLAGKVVHDSLV